ncbi:MAG: GlyGly-CTERM sorting domain-containing protein [Gammaproteobacteria bacterium]|nr:GlyGly-CTERM sorting domain-containing protein [Gammaproteobacteria bacterium]
MDESRLTPEIQVETKQPSSDKSGGSFPILFMLLLSLTVIVRRK